MIESLGWIALALGGAYALGCLVLFFVTGMGLGGLETVGPGLFLGGATAVAWIAFVVWWSPVTIGVQ